MAQDDPEAVARQWKPWAFDENDPYYPFRGALRAQAIKEASEVLQAARTLCSPEEAQEKDQ